MKKFKNQWNQLTALARQADDSRDLAAPYGFATRVIARAAKLPAGSPWAIFERIALRGLIAAAAISIASVAFNYSGHINETAEDYAGTDTVIELLGLS